jgi:hypothetical protein
VDLGLGVVVVKLGLERLAVDDTVQDTEGEGRVPRDLMDRSSRSRRAGATGGGGECAGQLEFRRGLREVAVATDAGGGSRNGRMGAGEIMGGARPTAESVDFSAGLSRRQRKASLTLTAGEGITKL